MITTLRYVKAYSVKLTYLDIEMINYLLFMLKLFVFERGQGGKSLAEVYRLPFKKFVGKLFRRSNYTTLAVNTDS